MQCQTCEAKIDARWNHAIKQNICPFCGESIMPEDLKNLLSTLAETMDELYSKYSDYLDNWLFSRYFLKKTGTTRPNSEGSDVINSDSSKFFKRSDASKPLQNQLEIKALAERVKSGGNEMLLLTPEEFEDIDANQVESEYQGSSGIIEDKIPAAVLAMTNKNSQAANFNDIKYLQKLQTGAEDARERMLSGASLGGKGGGFSR
jgi:hypothetical protein